MSAHLRNELRFPARGLRADELAQRASLRRTPALDPRKRNEERRPTTEPEALARAERSFVEAHELRGVRGQLLARLVDRLTSRLRRSERRGGGARDRRVRR